MKGGKEPRNTQEQSELQDDAQRPPSCQAELHEGGKGCEMMRAEPCANQAANQEVQPEQHGGDNGKILMLMQESIDDLVQAEHCDSQADYRQDQPEQAGDVPSKKLDPQTLAAPLPGQGGDHGDGQMS